MNENLLKQSPKSSAHLWNINRILYGDRFVNSAGGKKLCRVCRKGFNKKKGRDRVDSSLISGYGIKSYRCAKCFKTESK